MLRRLRRALAAASVALVVLGVSTGIGKSESTSLASAATSPAQPMPPPLFAAGVQAKIRSLSGAQLKSTIEFLRAGGVQYTREDFTWFTIEPRPGEFHWTATDAWVGAAARGGLRIIAVLDAPPSWATASWNTGPVSGHALPAYANFTAQVVARYGSRGTFWTQNPNLPRLPIQYYDIWNEPYSSEFWAKPFPNPAGYARMFQYAAAAGRAVDPSAKFMLEADTTSFGPNPQPAFLSALFDAVPNLADYIDVVSVHPYASNGWSPDHCSAGAMEMRRYQVCRLEDIRRILDQRGAAKAKLWITEMGWSTAPSAKSAVTEAVQARYVRDFFAIWRSRWASYVDGVIWYALWTPERNPVNRNDYFGLVRANGSAKPAWHALVEQIAMLPRSAAQAESALGPPRAP